MESAKKENEQLISVAVIDDGINEKLYSNIHLNTNIEINSELKFSPRSDYDPISISHGTICAAIIQKYSSCKILSSVKILNEKTKCSKKQLIKALEWCVDNNINLINLSLGSIDFRDYSEIKNVINFAYSKGIIIVAACSNKGIFTYPASLSNVVGVKCDRKNILKINDYIYNTCTIDGIDITANSQHELIDFMENKNYTSISNSFAAPVITALVYEMMKKNAGITLEKIKENLKISCKIPSKDIHPNIYTNIDWINKCIIFIINQKCYIYDISRCCMEVNDVVYIQCHNIKEGLHRIIEYIKVNKSILDSIDTLIIVNESIKFCLNKEDVFYINKISEYLKNIIYIDDNYSNPALLNWDLKTKIWNPSVVYTYYNQTMRNEIKFTVPIVIIYDFVGGELNKIVHDLSDKFRNDGYSVLSASDKAIGILYDCKFIPLNNKFKKSDEMDLSLLNELYLVYNPDIIIYGIDAVNKDNTKLLNFMKNPQIDINIFFTQEHTTSMNFREQVYATNSEVVILSKGSAKSELNQKINVFNYLDEKSISELYNHLILILTKD